MVSRTALVNALIDLAEDHDSGKASLGIPRNGRVEDIYS